MNIFKSKGYVTNVLLCVFYSTLCGIVTGALIFGFKFVAGKLEHYSIDLYNAAKGSFLYITLVFVVLIILAVLMYLLQKKVPEAKGGGIPRSEGVLRGILTFKWLRTLIGTITGSFMSYFAGLPLGTEGPAVIVGTSVGEMTGSVSKKRAALGRYVSSGGAAAGFAVATGAPLSGVLFALEEIHKRFTPMLVLTVSMSVVFATLTNRVLCFFTGIDPHLFHIAIVSNFQLRDVLYLILLAGLIALLVSSFDKTLMLINKFTSRYSKFFHPLIKLIIVFIITGILGFVFMDGIYSGHDVVDHIIKNDRGAWALFGLLMVRILMMHLLTDSGATGGIFIPVLAIAAIMGALLAKLLVLIGLNEIYFEAIVMLTMCAFIGGTLRAPFTATVLFLELTGAYTDLFYVILVVFIVNFITELFNQPSFYDRALEKLEEEQNHGKTATIAHFEVKISEKSFVVGKAVRDIMWPHSSVLISIKRNQVVTDDMDNDGEKKLYALDTIVLRVKYYDEEELRKVIRTLVGTDYPINKINS